MYILELLSNFFILNFITEKKLLNFGPGFQKIELIQVRLSAENLAAAKLAI